MRALNDTIESLKIALAAIKANKSRGVLTTLGIVIGILAVITTMTAANGLGNTFRESISALGSDVLYVSRRPWIMTGNFFQFRNRKNLGLKEAQKLEESLKNALAINPTTNTNKNIKYKSTTLEGITIIGTTDKHMMVTASVPDQGRFLTAFEVQFKKQVCVIGAEIKERLFEEVDPINKKIKLGRFKYRVVGVMEKQGSAGFFGGPNFDRQVFVPITSFMKSYGGNNRDFNIAVKAPPNISLANFEYEVVGEMRKIRKLKPTQEDDFSINQMNQLVGAYNNVMGVIVLIGIVITGISLFVGGIGVMNIMFVSVTERTREIGIRKAIGAKRRSILTQFLFESSTICLIGGFIGLVLAFGVTALISKFLMPASISMPIVMVAILVSVFTGVLSGFIPAFKASKLKPIEALRYE
ncbi:ABC transporter permease [candidate division KSB1 bacterium]|nr:ABC transporter permease [candidate division KSB1 bacterium]MCH8954748.1 ABC transporter permease [candidate division KSB1 bacterium]